MISILLLVRGTFTRLVPHPSALGHEHMFRLSHGSVSSPILQFFLSRGSFHLTSSFSRVSVILMNKILRVVSFFCHHFLLFGGSHKSHGGLACHLLLSSPSSLEYHL